MNVNELRILTSYFNYPKFIEQIQPYPNNKPNQYEFIHQYGKQHSRVFKTNIMASQC